MTISKLHGDFYRLMYEYTDPETGQRKVDSATFAFNCNTSSTPQSQGWNLARKRCFWDNDCISRVTVTPARAIKTATGDTPDNGLLDRDGGGLG